MSLKKKQGSAKKSQQQSPIATAGKDLNANEKIGGAEAGRTRLLELFSKIESEFDALHTENAALREKVDTLTERLDVLMTERSATLTTNEGPLLASSGSAAILSTSELPTTTPLRKIKSSGTNITKKLMPGSKKTTSNLKQTLECSYGCSFYGHKDGVWHVAYTKNGQPIIGSASADNTASLWDVNSGNMLLKYTGHTGSVNCISFHPIEPLVCTASGDGSAHVWKISVSTMGRQNTKHDSSGEDKSGFSDDETLDISTFDTSIPLTAKNPALVLAEHTGPVMACDWMNEGSQIVTASWDHSACLWDAQTGTTIHVLRGQNIGPVKVYCYLME